MKRMRKVLLTAVILIMVFTLVACNSGDDQGKDPSNDETKDAVSASLHFTPEEYPNVDGSTAAIPFSEAVAAATMDMPISEARLYVKHNKTDGAYRNLVDGNADIIFVSAPSEDQQSYADENGVELDIIPMLRGGFVFFVNEDNPVKSVKFSDIVDIYSGKITNWKELGGEDKEIIAYQRNENSGSQTGMLNLVMKGVPLMEPPMEHVIAGMGEIIDAVALFDNDVSAIGYSYYYYVQNMWGDENIKYLAIDDIMPSDETIGDGSYPIISTTCMVLRKDEPEGSNARKLADWILSEEGQAVAEENGYVKLR